MQNLQLFAWQSAARGNDVHLNANPTQGEILHQEFREKKDALKAKSRVSVLAKYGGEKYLDSAPAELRQGQTENYVEYSRTGQVIKGKEKAKARSKYPEDGMFMSSAARVFSDRSLSVFVNNHTAIWGSWYNSTTGTWGFACCHSSVHLSYCAGLAGREAAEASTPQALLNLTASSAPASTPPPVGERVKQNFSKTRVGEGEVELDRQKLAQALSDERKRKDHDEDADAWPGKKKAKTLKSGNHEVTEEELGAFQPCISMLFLVSYLHLTISEAYRMTRKMTEDPMANYIDSTE